MGLENCHEMTRRFQGSTTAPRTRWGGLERRWSPLQIQAQRALLSTCPRRSHGGAVSEIYLATSGQFANNSESCYKTGDHDARETSHRPMTWENSHGVQLPDHVRVRAHTRDGLDCGAADKYAEIPEKTATELTQRRKLSSLVLLQRRFGINYGI